MEGGVHNAQVFGEVAWLFARSPLHYEMPVRKLEQWAFPPIVLQQFRLYRREGRPVAFFSWAFLSEAVEKKYALSPQSLEPGEWRSGERLWIIDFIAPFGDTARVMRDLRETVFPNDVGRALRPFHNKNELRVIYFHGKNAVEKAHLREANPTVQLL